MVFESLYTTQLYPPRHTGWHKGDSQWKAERILEAVPTKLWREISSAPLRLLDAGCGAGGVLGNLMQRLKTKGIFCQGVGTDISEEALTMARQDWPGIDFQNAASANLPHSFDIGLLMDVVEHVENPWELVRRVKSRCAYVIFHIPLDASWLTECFNLYTHKTKTMGHIHFFTRRQALAFIRNCGMEILSWRLTAAFAEPSAYAIDGRHRTLWYARKILSFLNPSLCASLLGGYSIMIMARTP